MYQLHCDVSCLPPHDRLRAAAKPCTTCAAILSGPAAAASSSAYHTSSSRAGSLTMSHSTLT